MNTQIPPVTDLYEVIESAIDRKFDYNRDTCNIEYKTKNWQVDISIDIETEWKTSGDGYYDPEISECESCNCCITDLTVFYFDNEGGLYEVSQEEYDAFYDHVDEYLAGFCF